MSRVASRNTSPEIRVRKTAHGMGLRFRLHRNDLPGKPDIVFARRRVALFVHGCFWHRHLGCRKASTPKSSTEYWLAKFDANVSRDELVRKNLESLGWRVVVIWECETKDRSVIESILRGEVLGLGFGQ